MVPARLFDLWLNAKRRAARGRYDDAVARIYRLIEWTAQWQLKSNLGVDTSDLSPSMVPAGVEPTFGQDGKIRVGLWRAWQVVHEGIAGPAADFVAGHGASLKNLLQKRNRSILAHGFDPVNREDWQEVRSWTEDRFLPTLAELASESGLRKVPPQLPTEPPRSIVDAGPGGLPKSRPAKERRPR